MSNRTKYLKKFYTERYNKRKLLGKCTNCGLQQPTKNTYTCKKCKKQQQKRTHTKKHREYERLRSIKRYKKNPNYHKKICRNRINKLKDDVYKLYGNKCNCCNENIKEFLTIDHIKGKGNKDRKKSGNQTKFLKKIIKENNKTKYQILCMNCNWGRRFTIICPHKKTNNQI